jgi:hypothetical protein
LLWQILVFKRSPEWFRTVQVHDVSLSPVSLVIYPTQHDHLAIRGQDVTPFQPVISITGKNRIKGSLMPIPVTVASWSLGIVCMPVNLTAALGYATVLAEPRGQVEIVAQDRGPATWMIFIEVLLHGFIIFLEEAIPKLEQLGPETAWIAIAMMIAPNPICCIYSERDH